MQKTKELFYAHSGSGNHGCEALVRSTVKILDTKFPVLISGNGEQDQKYHIDSLVETFSSNTSTLSLRQKFSPFYLSYAFRYHFITRNASNFSIAALPILRKYKIITAISIGGDNYCYDGMVSWLIQQNAFFNKHHIPTVLWGCSIEPEIINDRAVLADLKSYALITTRESITYQALLNAGVDRNTHLYPDSAFQLNRVDLPLPDGFVEDNTVGVNVSPMIIDNETGRGITMENYKTLIRYILDETDMHIALIPHVVWESNDDRKPLSALYEMFKDTGRVVLIDDHNCMELKGYIARCRFFVGARTHATIAAYSSCVPTLVVGYSVKAKGIAKDLFGTYEHYVVPVQMLKEPADLKRTFFWMQENEEKIRNHLREIMPEYCARALKARVEVEKLLGKRR